MPFIGTLDINIGGSSAGFTQATRRAGQAAKGAAQDINKVEKSSLAAANEIRRARREAERYRRRIRQARRETLQFAESLIRVRVSGLGIIGIIASLTYAVTRLGRTINTAAREGAELGAELAKTSRQLGIATDELQILQRIFAAEGLSTEQATRAINRLSDAALQSTQGIKRYEEIFEQLGITVTDSSGRLKNATELMFETGRALRDLDNSTERTALATQLFGNRMTAVLRIFAQSDDAIKSLVQSQSQITTVSRDQAESAEALSQAFQDLTTEMESQKIVLASELAPEWEEFLENLREALPEITALAGSVGDAFLTAINAAISGFDRLRGFLAEGFETEVQDTRPGSYGGTWGPAGGLPSRSIAPAAVDDIATLPAVTVSAPRIQAPRQPPGTGAGPPAVGLAPDLAGVTELISTLAQANFTQQSPILSSLREFEDVLTELTEGRAVALLPDAINRIIGAMGANIETELPKVLSELRSEVEALNQVTLDEFAKSLVDLKDPFEKTKALFEETESALNNFGQAVILEGRSITASFKNLINSILAEVVRLQIIQPLASTIAGGLSGFFSGLFSGGGGGKLSVVGLGGRADGGPVGAGKSYIVGERGPELFVPNHSGTIVPDLRATAAVGGAGGGVTVNMPVSIDSTDGPGVRNALVELMPLIRREAVAAVTVALSRPGQARRSVLGS